MVKLNIDTLKGATIADIIEQLNEIKYYLETDHTSGYCSAKWVLEKEDNEDIQSGYWHGEDAWVLFDDGHEMYILVGGYTEDEALKVKELFDDGKDLGEYDNYVFWVDVEEWLEQQE